MLHGERMRPEEQGLLVLLLQEEHDAGLTFGKESHHLMSLAREATTASSQGVYTVYHNFEQPSQLVSKKYNIIIVFPFS